MRKRRREDFTLNIGTSSILFIFVILVLISFSVLSLSSALSDYHLTERVTENTEKYYLACNQAEEQICLVEDSLSELYSTGISRAGYFEKVGKKMSFSIPISDIQSLDIELKINYPDEECNSYYDIVSWKIKTVAELDYDDSLPVFK